MAGDDRRHRTGRVRSRPAPRRRWPGHRHVRVRPDRLGDTKADCEAIPRGRQNAPARMGATVLRAACGPSGSRAGRTRPARRVVRLARPGDDPLTRTRRRDARQRRRLAPTTRPRARGDPRHRYQRRGRRAPGDSVRRVARESRRARADRATWSNDHSKRSIGFSRESSGSRSSPTEICIRAT